MEQHRILLVDKVSDDTTVIESRLKARGHDVCVSHTSREAFEAIQNDNFDLVMVSSQMEVVGGLSLPELIRKAFHAVYVPIIMLVEENDLSSLLRGVEEGFDDFLKLPTDPLTLALRVAVNINRAKIRIEANPLTQLPGNIAIEKRIKDCIQSGDPFSVCYLDINNFKSFNDGYGYDKGDDILRQAARIISRTASLHAKDPFVGHVGGDDFIVILDPEEEVRFARECIHEFDRIMPTAYSAADREQGHMVVKNRKGRTERFPIISICIATVTNLYRTLTNPGEVAQVASEVKKYLKTQVGSAYLRDRRERQIDSLEDACRMLGVDGGGAEAAIEGPYPANTEPLGEMLVSEGLISKEQLQEGMKRHLPSGKRLGETLITMNLVKSEDVGRMLERKLGVEHIVLQTSEPNPEASQLLTRDFIREHRVIPLELIDGKLKLAMIDPFNLRLTDEIERQTGLSVIPCLSLEQEFEAFYERHYSVKKAI